MRYPTSQMYMTATRNVMGPSNASNPVSFHVPVYYNTRIERENRTGEKKKKKEMMLHVFVTPNLPLPFFLMPRCWPPSLEPEGLS